MINKAAQRSRTPRVVVAGESKSAYDVLDGQVAADRVEIERPFTQSDHNLCAWRVVSSQSLLHVMGRTWRSPFTYPRSPVFVALPMDVLDLPNVEPVVPTPVLTTRVAPEGKGMMAAAHLIVTAEGPLIVPGDGVTASDTQEELTHLAELVGDVVWGAACSEVTIAASHPRFAGFDSHLFGTSSAVSLSAPDAVIVIVCGTEVMPEVLPTVGIVKYNLREYREGARPADEAFPDSFDLTQPYLRSELLARAQGVDATRVEQLTRIQLAMNPAFANGRPFLIDLVLFSEL